MLRISLHVLSTSASSVSKSITNIIIGLVEVPFQTNPFLTTTALVGQLGKSSRLNSVPYVSGLRYLFEPQHGFKNVEDTTNKINAWT